MWFFINDWKKNQDKILVTGAFFLNLQRAFETVDKDLLIKKLDSFGFVEEPL